MSDSPITMYTTTWCGDCRRAKAYLKAHEVAYTEIDIESTDGAVDIVAEHNGGRHVVPTFEIDGRYYGNPPLNELGKILAER